MTDVVDILLIEDEVAHAELVQRAFEARGDASHLTCVNTLAEARSYLQSHTPQLIIADWRLPDGESLELLEGRDRLFIPMVIMTSYGNENIAVEAMRAGVLDYVVKSQEILMDMPHIAERAIQQWMILLEQERIQRALSESESQFRLLAENSTDLISRLTPDGVTIYSSPACRAMLGYEPAELVGNSNNQFVHPDDLEDISRVLMRIIKDPPVNITHSYRVRRKDGHYIWVESTLHAIFDDLWHKPTEIHISSRDITQRKRAEEDLRRTHHDLEQAYEATLNGWSHALDLRDRETEGHSQRVLDLTLSLARLVGISEDELVHIRRGVLLHDIGKLGVSDEILRKPGPLNEAEWVEMRRHPVYAFDMLYPIVYLHPAIDIPYCHHERWDGSGYPRGLKGEKIPLTARIFAIVDVWDALSSNRPYRKAWPRDQVIQYMQEQTGKQFDPGLASIFLSRLVD